MNILKVFLIVIFVWIQIIGCFTTPVQNPHKICEPTQNQDYSYQGANGPNYWAKLFPEFCAGNSQSPINIKSFVVASERTPLEFINYELPSAGDVVNNGLAVDVVNFPDPIRAIGGGGLSMNYSLSEIHFHWGKKSDRGSEHQIYGRKFPLEMHLVHSNEENQTLVVAVFFKETARNNSNLDPIISILRNVTFKDEQTPLPSPLNLTALLPPDRSHYRYNGSLTTPNCDEGVLWVVFRRALRVGISQLKALRELKAITRSEQGQSGETGEVAGEAGVSAGTGVAGEPGEVAGEAGVSTGTGGGVGEPGEVAGATGPVAEGPGEVAGGASYAPGQSSKESSRTIKIEYDECALVDNFRPVQPLNGRTVYFYQK